MFTKNLQYLHKQRGWNKTEASKEIGISYKQYCRLLKGEETKIPHGTTLVKIADAYGVSVSNLLDIDISLGRGESGTDYWDSLKSNCDIINDNLAKAEAFSEYLSSLGITVQNEKKPVQFKTETGIKKKQFSTDRLNIIWKDSSGKIHRKKVTRNSFQEFRRRISRFVLNEIDYIEDVIENK